MNADAEHDDRSGHAHQAGDADAKVDRLHDGQPQQDAVTLQTRFIAAVRVKVRAYGLEIGVGVE